LPIHQQVRRPPLVVDRERINFDKDRHLMNARFPVSRLMD
jgi:hypothetical protein